MAANMFYFFFNGHLCSVALCGHLNTKFNYTLVSFEYNLMSEM